MEIKKLRYHIYEVLEIHGRIDGLTAPDLKRHCDQEAVDGNRRLILDFTAVTYMSSAGLRVILQTHKSLTTIGGTLTLIAVPDPILEVFRVSGMIQVIPVLPELKSLISVEKKESGTPEIMDIVLNEIHFQWRKGCAKSGYLFSYGNGAKLFGSLFSGEDVIRVKSAEIAYGAGVGALGEDFREFGSLFGESIVVGHHFFSYPAVPKPVIDYAYFKPESGDTLNFLYGFGFTGEFSRVLRFDTSTAPVSLDNLFQAAGKLAETDVFGLVVLGKSGGIDWMHLRKTPLSTNKPAAGSIFDMSHFQEWMKFSVEPEDHNKTVVGCGIVLKNQKRSDEHVKTLFPQATTAHFHGLILQNGLWSNNILDFEEELQRIIKEFEAEKVVHLLPSSRLKNGYLGIVNLEGF